MRESDPLIDTVSEQGQKAHGLYFSEPMLKMVGASGLIKRLRASGLDAAVIDFKDGEGRVAWDTHIASLAPQKRKYVADMPAFIAELKAAGIYTIARIVCFSDPYLPRNEPDRAVMDGRPNKKGVVWASWGKRNTWLDPYNVRNHDLVVEMAKEVEAVGVDELQFDYIRFPVDEATSFAVFPAQVETLRRNVLLGMIKRIDAAVRIPIGADVFGLTALEEGDPSGLGQSLNDWAANLDVFSPMLYLKGMTSMMPKGEPERARRLIYIATNTLRKRIGPGPVIRPFIQAFEAGSDYYNPEFIAEQIQGARDGGSDGFLFWHPGSNYSMVRQGMAGPAHALVPFPIQRRIDWRRAHLAEGALAAGRMPVPSDADRADAEPSKGTAPKTQRSRTPRPQQAYRASSAVRVPVSTAAR